MRTKAEMIRTLQLLGINKQFKPYQDEQNETILLLTRKPVTIADGSMHGCEIAIQKDRALVWTNQKNKAVKLAKLHNLKIRLLDREAEVQVPFFLCDSILPMFGAKIKQRRSPERIAMAIEALRKARG